MNDASYVLTAPAQLEQRRAQALLADRRVTRSIERIRQLARSLGARPPKSSATQ